MRRLLILATPHQLGVEIRVARVTNRLRLLMLLLDNRLLLGGGDVFPLGVVVLEGLDGFVGGRLFLGGHG
jgi:hypothetical protein